MIWTAFCYTSTVWQTTLPIGLVRVRYMTQDRSRQSRCQGFSLECSSSKLRTQNHTRSPRFVNVIVIKKNRSIIDYFLRFPHPVPNLDISSSSTTAYHSWNWPSMKSVFVISKEAPFLPTKVTVLNSAFHNLDPSQEHTHYIDSG